MHEDSSLIAPPLTVPTKDAPYSYPQPSCLNHGNEHESDGYTSFLDVESQEPAIARGPTEIRLADKRTPSDNFIMALTTGVFLFIPKVVASVIFAIILWSIICLCLGSHFVDGEHYADLTGRAMFATHLMGGVILGSLVSFLGGSRSNCKAH
ncbi:hypothetical protein A0H81_13868 [Grifola frondosa]|uniref:Uncharacterized protein n=1 Tax=Grifola frondosa TaxID=5627 RepID=A0A1C7LN66_GRIFR|nr:hypothetical protein A0H81_13868 [Grifola frondosa]